MIDIENLIYLLSTYYFHDQRVFPVLGNASSRCLAEAIALHNDTSACEWFVKGMFFINFLSMMSTESVM
jgi:hypothetical protein